MTQRTTLGFQPIKTFALSGRWDDGIQTPRVSLRLPWAMCLLPFQGVQFSLFIMKHTMHQIIFYLFYNSEFCKGDGSKRSNNKYWNKLKNKFVHL